MTGDIAVKQSVHWGQLRERRIALVAYTFALPLALLASVSWIGPWAALACLVAWLILFRATLAARCPRCRERFADGLVLPINTHCRHCGTPQFAPAQVHGPFENPLTPSAVPRQDVAGRQPAVEPKREAREISRRARRWVGAAQVIAGSFILLTLGSTVMRGALGAWELWSRAGFAALAVIGGVTLYRGQRSGYAITRFVLAAQMVAFVLPGAAYEVLVGFYGGASIGSDGARLNVGWNSQVLLWVGGTTGWRIRFNVLALVLLSLIPAPRGRSDPHAPTAE